MRNDYYYYSSFEWEREEKTCGVNAFLYSVTEWNWLSLIIIVSHSSIAHHLFMLLFNYYFFLLHSKRWFTCTWYVTCTNNTKNLFNSFARSLVRSFRYSEHCYSVELSDGAGTGEYVMKCEHGHNDLFVTHIKTHAQHLNLSFIFKNIYEFFGRYFVFSLLTIFNST